MGDIDGGISENLRSWLTDQPVFFVASAPLGVEGSINCSPKGNRGEFAVIGPECVAYLDQTGSGVETIAHLRENGRLVIMFCAFSGPPRIVRLHGRARVLAAGSTEFTELAGHFANSDEVGARSIIVLDVTRLSDSCGYGVPLMDFSSHRPTMDQWSSRKGPEGIREYQRAKNAVSVDGLAGLAFDGH